MLDYLPGYWVHANGQRRIDYGQYGCSSGFCNWAAKLDDRWQTGIYKPVP